MSGVSKPNMSAIKGGKREALGYMLTDKATGKPVLLNWANCIYAEPLNGEDSPTFILLVQNGSIHCSLTVLESLDHLFERPVTLDGRQQL